MFFSPSSSCVPKAPIQNPVVFIFVFLIAYLPLLLPFKSVKRLSPTISAGYYNPGNSSPASFPSRRLYFFPPLLTRSTFPFWPQRLRAGKGWFPALLSQMNLGPPDQHFPPPPIPDDRFSPSLDRIVTIQFFFMDRVCKWRVGLDRSLYQSSLFNSIPDTL